MSFHFQNNRAPERTEASSSAVNPPTQQEVSHLFPTKTLKDDKTSVDEKIVAVSFYYGSLVSEVFCRTKVENGVTCRSNCTCLYDVFLGDNNGGEPNATLIHATADFVVKNYYQESGADKLRTLQKIIKKAKEDYPDVDPDKRRYYLPCLTTTSQLYQPAAATPWESPPVAPRRRYICMYAVTTLFGVGMRLWETCLLTANAGRVSKPNEENHHSSNTASNTEGGGPKRKFGGLTNTNLANNLFRSKKNAPVKSSAVLDFLPTKKQKKKHKFYY
eukprot:scaffold16664_cov161-Amphora_coffeaeformis.AAC.3